MYKLVCLVKGLHAVDNLSLWGIARVVGYHSQHSTAAQGQLTPAPSLLVLLLATLCVQMQMLQLPLCVWRPRVCVCSMTATFGPAGQLCGRCCR